MTATYLCIYHGNCADGFTAAWVVREYFRRLHMEAEIDFHAGFYQAPPPDVTGRRIIMVDFSYKRGVLVDMASKAESILVLDHHKTAEADLIGFELPEQCLPKAGDYPWLPAAGLNAFFDMDRSGAGLAWDYFFPDEWRPKLIDIVEDRDLWRFQYPYTRAVQAAIFSYPYDFEVWDMLVKQAGEDLTHLANQGQAIERKHFKDITELLKILKHRMTIAGWDVPVANLPYIFSSDAGNTMAQGEPFAACYYDKPEGREFSLRSAPDGIDVSEIAARFGGGGHKHAAGFRVPHGAEVA